MRANPIADTGPWTLGTLIGFPVGIVLTLAGIGLAVTLLVKRGGADKYDREGFLMGAALFGAMGLVAGGLTIGGMYPFSGEFHQWRAVSGKVEQVNHRLIGTGDGMSERYVVVIEGRPFGIDDTRASLVKEGDTLNLRCKREFEYAADSGWACRWGGAA